MTDQNEDYKKYLKDLEDIEESFTKEEKNNIKANVSKINEKYFETQFTTPDHIYIELPLIKDLYIGALFAMIVNKPNAQELYTYIKENLGEYQLRFFDDPLEYFPKLNITKEEFTEFFNNSKNHNNIFYLAPYTLFRVALRHNLLQNAQHSKITEKFTKLPNPKDPIKTYIKDYDDVNFYINLYPLKIHNSYKSILQRVIGDLLGVNVILLESDPRSISPKFLERMDEINTFRLDILMENELLRKSFSEFNFVGKMLYAPLLADPDKRELASDEETKNKERRVINAALKCMCFFKWIEAARYAIDLDVYKSDDDEEEGVVHEELPSLETE